MKKLLTALAITVAIAAPVAYDALDAYNTYNHIEATHQAHPGQEATKFFGPAF